LVFLKEFTVFSIFEKYFVLRSKTLFTSELTREEYLWLQELEGTSRFEPTEQQLETLKRVRLISDEELTDQVKLQNDCDRLDKAQDKIFLRMIELMVAQSCNMSCVYCYGSDGEYGHRSIMSQETAFKSIDFLRDELAEHDPEGAVKPTVIFFGGEPLIAADLIRSCVLYAESIWGKGNVDFGTTTNLTLMTEDLLDFFIEHNVKMVVSFDGTPELQRAHRTMKNGEDSYQIMVEKSRMVLAKAPQTPCRATRYIDEDERAIAAGIQSLGFKDFQINAVSGNLGDGTTKSDVFYEYRQRTEHCFSYAQAFVQAARNQDIDALQALWDNNRAAFSKAANLLEKPAASRRIIYCGSGRTMAAVSVDGKMYPCHRFVGSEFQLGTLDSFDRRLSRCHQITDNPKCRACAYRFGCPHPCMHICACDSPDEPGVDPLLRAPQAYCEMVQTEIHVRAYLHATLSPDELFWLRQHATNIKKF